MLKWSRKAAEEMPRDPYLFVLCWSAQDQYTNDNKEKTKILVKRFFPGAGQVDLQDISSQDYLLLLEISQTVSSKEMKDAI